MTGTLAVHQCLFCPQIFRSATEKDDHVLEHFAQETCADCDQNLIRIGTSLYILHNEITCIKRQLKSDLSISHENHGEYTVQTRDIGNFIEFNTPSSLYCDQQFEIKIEPETEQDEPPTFIYGHGESNNRNRDEHHSAQRIEQSNTVFIHQVEVKVETDRQDELKSSQATRKKYPCKHKCDICGKMFQGPFKLGQHKKYAHSAPGTVFERFQCEICHVVMYRAESLRKHMQIKHGPNRMKFNCDFCWAIFLSKKSLDKHLPRCKRPKKSAVMSVDTKIQGSFAGQTQDVQSVLLDTKHVNETSSTHFDSTQMLQNSSQEKPSGISNKRIYKEEYARVPCDICGKVLYEFWINRHKKLKHRPREAVFDKLECDICKRIIHKKESMRRHMQMKHNPNRIKFKCDYCFRVFLLKKSLENHLTSCNGRKTNLNKPLNDDKISKEKCHICEICGETFATRNSVKTHSYLVHKTGGHHCIYCKSVFFTAEGLMNHGSKCEKLSIITFECYMCHKVCSSRKYLLHHMLVKHSSNGKKFKCDSCPMRFVYKSHRERHNNRVHLKIKIQNFVCSTCERAFTNRFSLKQHEYIHTGEKPLKCKYEGCDRYFRTHNSRSVHFKTHTGQKQYQCKIDGCSEQFWKKISLEKHNINVHGIQ